MKRIRWILISLCLLLGTISGFYLHRTIATILEFKFSDDAVRHLNEAAVNMLRKDPKTLHRINRIIASSPYLKEQKKAFFVKYYGHMSAVEQQRAERFLRLYLVARGDKGVDKK